MISSCLTVICALMTAPSTSISTPNDRSPDVSPDGKFIAFESRRDRNSDIYICRSDGSELRRITTNPGVDGAPAWSPDGKQIAFHALRNDNYDVYVMDADGGNERRLTTHEGLDLSPSWSNDGGSILYSAQRSSGDELRMIQVDGQDDFPIIDNIEHHTRFELSPGDEWMLGAAVTRQDWDLVVMRITGESRRVIAGHAARDGMPAWSPDGKHIAFASKRDGGDWHVYTVDLEGDRVQRLTTEGVNYEPTWFPSGERIAFTAKLDGGSAIYTMKPDGTDIEPLNPRETER